MDRSRRLDTFIDLSADLTGFDAPQLVATGNAEAFHDLVEARCGAASLDALLATYSAQVAGSPERDRALRLTILGDAQLGPMARNLLRLWYSGTWRRMPADWRAAHAPGLPDEDTVPSRTAYTEGLLWPAVGANPPGAKPFGYGMWAKPPRVTLD